MRGQRSLFLNARSARFAFGYDDSSVTNLREIIIIGQTDQDNATNIAGVTFVLKVKEVTDDFKYDKMKNPDEEYQNGESYCYGNAIFLKPGECIKEATIDIDLLLTFTEFSNLKYVMDKFFLGTVELLVIIQIIGMELGFEPCLDKFPAEHNLPVVGYKFVVRSKEIAI